MKEQSKREYCYHCRRWLDGDTYYVDIAMNRYFCGAWCATHAEAYDTVEATRIKAPKPEAEPESAPTRKPLEVPDIYLAELVGVVRRALQADGLTERLWAILDDWCDGAESYLEKKYPEAHEQATGIGTAAVDWLNSRGPAFPGLDTFIRTGYNPAPISPEDYEKLSSNGLIAFSMRDTGIKYTSSDGQRFVVAENDSTCTCQGFQGSNPTCASHGEGTAWHDLHGGK